MPFNRSTDDPWSAIEGRYDKALLTNQTTTSNVVGDVPGTSFNVEANQSYSFEFVLFTGCSGTGGIKFALNLPAGATFRASAHGMAALATAITSAIMNVINTLTSIVFNNANLQTGWVRITGTVVNGANAGVAQLRFASGTNGQTSTIYANSTPHAVKL